MAKSSAATNEYISVRDHRDQGLEVQLSSHDPLDTSEMRGTVLSSLSCAHLSSPVSRNYTLRVEKMGRLTDASAGRVALLFGRIMSGESFRQM